MRFTRHLSLMSMLALAGLVGLQGCGDDEVITPDPAEADVLFVHAASAAPAVDILVDNAIVRSNLAFGAATNGYIHVEEGTRRIRLTPVGDSANALFDGSVPLVEERMYTAFAVTDTAGTPSILIFEDNLESPKSGKAYIRLAHLVPDGPAIRIGIPGSGIGPIQQNVKYRDNTAFFQEVNAGQTTFLIADNAGGGGSNPPAIVPNIDINLEDGGFYTIAVMGTVEAENLRSLVIRHEHHND